MSSTDDIITDILRREGAPTNDPDDRGGRTAFGIAEASNPEAWKDGQVTEDEARRIYHKKYVVGPGFDKVKDPLLRAQLVDFGVNSGPFIAIKHLQQTLNVEADGILGEKTLKALSTAPSDVVSRKLVAARLKMIVKIVQKNPSQLKFLGGWVNRALEFLV